MPPPPLLRRCRPSASVWAGSLLALVLAGCASAPPAVQPPATAGPLPTVWRLSGRVALRQGDEGWNASLDWHQNGQHFLLQLQGPLGQAALALEGTPDDVWLRSGEHLEHADDLDALAARHLGFAVPLVSLRHWLFGQPQPDAPASLQHTSDGRIARIDQHGWQVRPEAWRDTSQGVLPGRLIAERADLRLRLVVDAWQFPE